MNLPNRSNIAIVILSIALAFVLLQKCGSGQVVIDPNIELKKSIALITKQRDSALKLSRKVDTVRIAQVAKWRKLKPKLDSIPCPEALADVIIITDSIITVDSTQISLLKQVIESDSIIISRQSKIIINDSLVINKLTRKVKRIKRQRNLAAALGAGGWILAFLK